MIDRSLAYWMIGVSGPKVDSSEVLFVHDDFPYSFGRYEDNSRV